MAPALQYWTIAYSALLLTAHAALSGDSGTRALQAESTSTWPMFSGDSGTRALQAESTSTWPIFSIKVVKPTNPEADYTMVVRPVLIDGGRMIRYDAYAKFLPNGASGIDKLWSAYDLIDGVARVTRHIIYDRQSRYPCLGSISGNDPIPDINLIFREIMNIPWGTHHHEYTCHRGFTVNVDGKTYIVCYDIHTDSFTVNGEYQLTVTRTNNFNIPPRTADLTCAEVIVEPFPVIESVGKALLTLTY